MANIGIKPPNLGENWNYMWINRAITPRIIESLKLGKSILLFGPRQSGKTSLVRRFEHDIYLTLMDPQMLQRYESRPGDLISYIKAARDDLNRRPVVIIDEVQKIPSITDAIQILIDDNVAQFIITGSSARKIKNLLPGRVIKYTLGPLSLLEIDPHKIDLSKTLVNGTLPEIHTLLDQKQIDDLLQTYVNLYIEEEIRKEALVRNIGAFTNFFRLAAIESGNIINLSRISADIGVNHHTIGEYYAILRECSLLEIIEPITKSTTRKRLTKSPKYIIADLGIKRVGSDEPINPGIKLQANLFEQFIGLELHRMLEQTNIKARVMYWRSHDGPEVDYVIDHQQKHTPIVVKWTDKPTEKDARHLLTFLREYAASTDKAYIICRSPHPMQIAENVTALPWQHLRQVLPQN